MSRPFLLKLGLSFLTVASVWTLCTLQAQSPENQSPENQSPENQSPENQSPKPAETEKKQNPKPARKPKTITRIPLAQAREQAALLHKVYASTLDVVHHHFFRNERAILPARAIEDIFADIERETDIESRWVAVNTKAMSVNHEPESDFEALVVKELDAGKQSVEQVEEGYFRSATPIPLGARCIGCHTGVFSAPAATPRMAALVISIPIIDETATSPSSKE